MMRFITPFTVAAPAVQPGPVAFTDPGPLNVTTTYYYRVRAEKVLTSPAVPGKSWTATSSWSATAQMQAAAIAQLSPASLTFPKQSVGTTSGAQTVTLTDVGALTLDVVSVALTGPSAADYVITSNGCGADGRAKDRIPPTMAFKRSISANMTWTYGSAPGAR